MDKFISIINKENNTHMINMSKIIQIIETKYGVVFCVDSVNEVIRIKTNYEINDIKKLFI